QQKRIAPAMEVLRGDTEKRLLVHLFSNGGAQQACQLARIYRKATGGKLLPVQAMVLDSGPGLSRIKQGVAAMTVGLPKMWILRMVGILFTYISLTLLVMLARIRGTDVISRSRDSLNDMELIDGNMSRCYIYSLADPMVAWQDVVSHAEEAEEKGWRVVTEKYIDSGHAAHLRQDEDRYWGVVKSLWASSKS
ncbi:MAG: hypothetical protein M1835_007520, partial [Candelina submexicana]